MAQISYPENDYDELISNGTILGFAPIVLRNSTFKAGFANAPIDKQPLGVELAFATIAIAHDFQRAINAGTAIVEPLK